MFKLTFVTPEKRIVVDKDLVSVSVPAFRGMLNILPGHAPLTTALVPGHLTYLLTSGEEKTYSINWGYCQVNAAGVSVMAESAVLPSEVNRVAASAELKSIENKLATQSLDDAEYGKALLVRDQLQSELSLSEPPI